MTHDVTKQVQYWRQFTQVKENCFYLHEYIAKDERFQWWLTIGLALGTSSAISAWLVWRDIPYVWATIVGLTQVAQILSPLMPQRHRIKTLHGISIDMEELSLKMEDDWNKVESGKATDDQIHDLVIKYKRKAQKIYDAHMKGSDLPERPKLSLKARQKLVTFIGNQYPHLEIPDA